MDSNPDKELAQSKWQIFGKGSY